MDYFKIYLNTTQEVGFVKRVLGDIAYVNGLPGAKPSELVIFDNGAFGQILSMSHKLVEVMILSKGGIKAGSQATRTGAPLEIPAGEELLSHVINPFGAPFESHKQIPSPKEKRSIEGKLLGISKRRTIKKNFETGVSIVDLMIPLGRGQRQLIIGDRKTGKSTFLLQTMLSYAKQGNICIYAAIGKKKIEIKKIEEFLTKNGVMNNVIIVASTAQDLPGVIYLTPYSAMTLAEYFRDLGRDTLIIFGDLSTHAKFYREIALLGNRFPGRNSYPPDMFYRQARLLERGGNFAVGDREASITCLPVAETLQGDLSGYIQTNIMSMTDGHIFFDNNLFYEGRRPAVNKFLSVTRVGLQTQTSLKKALGRELFSTLTLFSKMQNFVHFGAELSQTTKETILTGTKINELFDQGASELIPINVQMVLIALFWGSKIPRDNTSQMLELRTKMINMYQKDSNYKKVIDDIVASCKTYNELLKNVDAQAPVVLKI